MNALDKQIGGNHYSSMAIQPVKFILANRIPFMEGSVIEYVCRWRNKGGIQDLEKARHLLDILIEHEELVEKVGWDKEAEGVRKAAQFPESINDPSHFSGFTRR